MKRIDWHAGFVSKVGSQSDPLMQDLQVNPARPLRGTAAMKLELLANEDSLEYDDEHYIGNRL